MQVLRTSRAALFALLAGLIVGACATAYESTLESWKGAPAVELMAAWGPPHERFLDDQGRRIYQWSYREIGEGRSDAAFHYQKSGERTAPFCQTRFVVDESGVIRGWAYRGNDCFGAPRS